MGRNRRCGFDGVTSRGKVDFEVVVVAVILFCFMGFVVVVSESLTKRGTNK